MLNKSIIGKAAITITLISLLSRVLGFLREILFANYYGTNKEYEIYLVASIIPLTINTISIFFYQNYFIPNYAKTQNEYPEGKEYFVRKTFLSSIIFSFMIVLILIVFSEQILTFYAGKEILNDKIIIIFSIFSLTIIPAILSSFLSAYLNSRNHFGSPAFSLLFINIATIISLIYFKSTDIIPIAIGYLVGSLLQLFYLLIKSDIKSYLKIKKSVHKYSFNVTYSSILSILLIEIIGQLYVVSDRYFYSSVDSGGIASLNYATNIFLLPVSIFTISLTTAIMPKISDLSAKGRLTEMSEMVNKLFSFSFLFFIPFVLIFLLQGNQIVEIFLERGSFDSVSTETTAGVLFYLSLSLIFYVVYSFLNKFLYSLQKTNFLLLLTISVLIIKFIMNYLLVDALKQNGLAIATSLSYLIFFILAFIKLQSDLKLKLNIKVYINFLFYLFNSFLSFIITSIIVLIIQQNGIFFNSIFTIIFLVIYYFNNQIFKDENQTMILNQLKISK